MASQSLYNHLVSFANLVAAPESSSSNLSVLYMSEGSTFSEVLPSIADSVNKLSEVVQASTSTASRPVDNPLLYNVPKPLQRPDARPPEYPKLINIEAFDIGYQKNLLVPDAVVTLLTSFNYEACEKFLAKDDEGFLFRRVEEDWDSPDLYLKRYVEEGVMKTIVSPPCPKRLLV